MTTSPDSSATAPAYLNGGEGPLVLVAQFYAQPEGEEKLKARLLDMADRTVGERGCLRYEIHQEEADPRHFVLLESWADQAALDVHMDTPHVQALLKDVPTLTVSDIELLRLRKL